MTPNGKLANAWILLSEDEPSGATYDTPGSSYQMLIENNVYRSVDVLFICFVNTVPTSPATVPAAQAGIDARLFAYGAKFEAIGPGPDEPPYQTAAEAITQNAAKYHSRIFTNWP